MTTRAERPTPPAPPLAAIVGPTGSGKSDLAMALASRLPVEIVVADSRQVYRGMDIGTAKPGAEDQARVRHHQLDLVAPDEPFTLADWLAGAREVIPDVWARGRVPLLVGGTGLYVTALADGYQLAAHPPSAELRQTLASEMEQIGLAPLAARLADLDPDTAARTDPRNPRRVLRALERVAVAGGPADPPTGEPWPGRLALLGVERSRQVLVRRIDRRAAGMFAAGLVDEVRELRDAGYGPELPPLSGIGYREAFRVVAGEWDVERAIAETARRTRQYAKRQLTWFRRDRRIVWMDAGLDPAERLAARAAETIRLMIGW
jgi:tRNA dimethylallyltransferase